MSKSIRKSFIILAAILPVIAVFCAYPTFGGVSFAANYGGKNSAELWYYQSGALDVNMARSVVESWDKSKLSPVLIAVADTGIDVSHELFSGVLYTENGETVGYNSRTNKRITAAELADNAVNADGKLEKHGNSVAGVIAMVIKELGLQDYIKIYPIKANSLSRDGKSEVSSFSISSVVRAINKANEIGACAINLSLGIYSSNMSSDADWAKDRQLDYAIDNARENTLIVCAAGNDENGGRDSAIAGDRFFPAAREGVFSVMNYKQDGAVHPNSNFGDAYDIAAPGTDIYTAKFTSASYQTISGTSLATPFASVAAALIKLRYMAEGKTVPSGDGIARMLKNLDSAKTQKEGYSIRLLDYGALLTQDFENTEYDYAPPVSIKITHNGELGTAEYEEAVYMQATKVQPLTFIARLNPYGETSPDLYDSIQWILRSGEGDTYIETSLGTGAKLVYSAEVFGDTAIIARLVYGETVIEESQAIHIEYAPYLAGEVRVTYAQNMYDDVSRAPSGGVLYTNATTVFALTGLKYADRTVPIKWFVNGELAGEGFTFAFKPTKAGDYKISAQYGDNPVLDTTYVFSADVRPFIVRPLDLAMFVLGLCIIIAAATVGAVLVGRHKKSKEAATAGKGADSAQG